MKTATYQLWVGHSLLFKIAKGVLIDAIRKILSCTEIYSKLLRTPLATKSSQIVKAVAKGQVIVISVTDKACSFEQAISSLFSI